MEKQEVVKISIADLVLWTENPRDPINARASDQEIVNRAIADKSLKWSLPKLAKEMGEYFDFSELPTVVYHGKTPVVYDGNRRIILAKIKHGIVSVPDGLNIKIPDFPEEIPCNVCQKKIALANVYRKHSDTGSWLPLERDIFLHKFMGQEKSTFLVLEEDTGIISSNPHLNQRFVKEEVFKSDTLNTLGFFIKNGRLNSFHPDDDGYRILSDISEKIKNKKISTRENRGKVIETLDPKSQQIIDHNKSNKHHLSKIKFDTTNPLAKQPRQSRRILKKTTDLFGGKLYLKTGEVSNLYRDISDLYIFYKENQAQLSNSFPGLIRMSLRLLSETAANGCKKKLDDFLRDNFDEAKMQLDQDIKTMLSTQNVKKESILQLLHTGAHNYQSTANMEQTIAVSIIVGAILTTTYGKEE